MENLLLIKNNSQISNLDKNFLIENRNKLKFTNFSFLIESKSYIPITSCVLEHIITTTNLTPNEKLYYILVDSLALVRKNNGYNRSCALPSEDWAKHLRCSRSLIFAMQKSLEEKGYFIINKSFDSKGRNNRNLITPTLPATIFNYLNEKFLDKTGKTLPFYNTLKEGKRSYLDRTKLFIKLNYNLLKIITSSNYLNQKQKLLWLSFYSRCYKKHMLRNREDSNNYTYDNDLSFSFISSYKEIAVQYSCNVKDLSKSLTSLEKLGFLKTENIHFRKKTTHNEGLKPEERQDESLWKITLLLPEESILELEKLKNRSNLGSNSIEMTDLKSTVKNQTGNCLILEGVKVNLTSEQSELLKSFISSNLKEREEETLKKSLTVEVDRNKIFPLSISQNYKVDNTKEKNEGIRFDPPFAKSGLLLNKELELKEYKSNLEDKQAVFLNNFSKKHNNEYRTKDEFDKGNKEFNTVSELVRKKIKYLPKDKANKARKFAYSLISRNLTTGYAASLSKNELAKQLIYHAASWKPTRLGNFLKEKTVDIALSVAWKAIVNGQWKCPFKIAKAYVLDHEFNHYKQKYLLSGIISPELKKLENETEKLLGKWYDLEQIIKSEVDLKQNNNLNEFQIHSPLNLNFTSNINNNTFIEDFNTESISDIQDSSNIKNLKHEEVLLQNNFSLCDIDLSNLSDDQKYLTIRGTETEMLEIVTADNSQYYGKLKTMEVNDNGEIVMTLTPNTKEEFIKRNYQTLSTSKNNF